MEVQEECMAVDAIKDKVSKEFFKLICSVRKGHYPDYETLLEEISFIELMEMDMIDNSMNVSQYYLNKIWQQTKF